MDRLGGRTALVTGGAMGIGRATARVMAQEGAQVAITDVRDDDGHAALHEICQAGDTARYYHLDVTDENQVQRVFGKVKDDFGSIDVLVNNAGIAGTDKPTDELMLDEWQEVIAVNVTGVFLCTKHVVPYMKPAGSGSIINLSSIYGIISAPDIPPYHASKGAVRSMTKTDALLYAADGIRVNSVHPGFIWTPLVEDLANRSDDGPEAFRQRLNDLHPLGHPGEPDDIAWGIVYLASDEAKFMTGSELVIDGGYTAR